MRKFASLFMLCISFLLKSIAYGDNPAIFSPVYAEDSVLSQKISLIDQQWKIDVYPGYAVVNTNYWFNNPTSDSLSFEVLLPSCRSPDDSCSPYYWLRIMINNRRAFAAKEYSMDSLHRSSEKKVSPDVKNSLLQLFTIDFQPGVTQVTLNYGITTEGIPASNAPARSNYFALDFSKLKWWTGNFDGNIWIRMNGGLVTADVSSLQPHKEILAGNSILFLKASDIISDSSKILVMEYRQIQEHRFNPSRVSWEMQYSRLKSWDVNEKILATLSPFEISESNEEVQAENKNTSPTKRLALFLGIGIGMIFLVIFIWPKKRKAI